MPSAYHLYTAKEFPSTSRFGTEDQLYLTVDHEQNRENVHSTVKLGDTSFRPGAARYECEHDFLTRLRYPGRARNMQFEQFVTPYRFSMYLLAGGEGSAGTVVVNTKGKVAADFIKRMNQMDGFSAIEKHIDFEQLRAKISGIRGAWFHRMKVSNLSTTGLFGPHVDKSDEFARAQRHGSLHSLTVPHDHDGSEYVLMITEAGSIIVFDTLDTEEQGVELVQHVKATLLDGCWDMGG